MVDFQNVPLGALKIEADILYTHPSLGPSRRRYWVIRKQTPHVGGRSFWRRVAGPFNERHAAARHIARLMMGTATLSPDVADVRRDAYAETKRSGNSAFGNTNRFGPKSHVSPRVPKDARSA